MHFETLYKKSIKEKFIQSYNELMGDKEQVTEDTRMVIDALTDIKEFDEEIAELKSEIEVVSGLVEKLVRANTMRSQNQNEYATKYDELSKRYEAAKERLHEVENNKLERKAKGTTLNAFITEMEKCDSELNEWSDDIWMLVCECGIVHHDGTITF